MKRVEAGKCMGVGRTFFKRGKLHYVPVSRRGHYRNVWYFNGQNKNIFHVLMVKIRKLREPGGGNCPILAPSSDAHGQVVCGRLAMRSTDFRTVVFHRQLVAFMEIYIAFCRF